MNWNLKNSHRVEIPYGGSALTWAHDSLYMVGIPEERTIYRWSLGPDIIQKYGWVRPYGDRVGGLLWVDGNLIVSTYLYYDADYSAKDSHHIHTKTASHKIGTLSPGAVGGFMAMIPEPYRKLLGGRILTGQSCLPIISRSSLGPAATAFWPGHLGKRNPVPASHLLGYPIDHPTLGRFEDTVCNPQGYNMATKVNGVVFPEPGDEILFFGTQALGKPCYGEGTASELFKGDNSPGEYCYDPSDFSKGTHGYPYVGFMWSYKVSDLIAVKQGKKKMWEPLPYRTWQIPFAKRIDGAAYDRVGQRIFLSECMADGEWPVVHELKGTQ